MFRGLLVRTNVQTYASGESVAIWINASQLGSDGGHVPLTSNADVVYRASIRGAQHQSLAVGAERLLGFISIRKRRAQAVPQQIVLYGTKPVSIVAG